MGHYSLWTVFNALELGSPTSIEPMLSHHCVFKDGNTSSTPKNDYSFPDAGAVRFKYPAKGDRPAISLTWHEGGMRPPTPEELDEDHQEFLPEQMMFVGDKGKILAGFHVDSPRLIPESRMKGRQAPPAPPRRGAREERQISPGLKQWIAACHGGAQSPGSFLNAGPISEAVNLYAVALRTRRRLLYDGATKKITNVAEANKYLAREYRKGWEL
jgi:hypothetical protein